MAIPRPGGGRAAGVPWGGAEGWPWTPGAVRFAGGAPEVGVAGPTGVSTGTVCGGGSGFSPGG
ncbi:hypothetical protein [Corallococcus praedator]|uniref:hypothetical protein n=1 Tax=Corallococcus praedator TaxID=2316724 RepID=UPI0013152BF5|nr:hypothetical protein [Corallococcus praedator]